MYFSTVIQGMQLEPVLVLSFQFWVLRKGFLCPSFLNFSLKLFLFGEAKICLCLFLLRTLRQRKDAKIILRNSQFFMLKTGVKLKIGDTVESSKEIAKKFNYLNKNLTTYRASSTQM